MTTNNDRTGDRDTYRLLAPADLATLRGLVVVDAFTIRASDLPVLVLAHPSNLNASHVIVNAMRDPEGNGPGTFVAFTVRGNHEIQWGGR